MKQTRVWALGWEDPSEKEMATPLQYSCLVNPMDKGAWQAIVHVVTQSQIQLSYQARTQEGGTMARSSHTLRIVVVKSLSPVQLFEIPWTVAHQAPPSMGFSRQEYWSGLPFPSPGDLPDPGIEPRSPAFQADALTSELWEYWAALIQPLSFRNYFTPNIQWKICQWS